MAAGMPLVTRDFAAHREDRNGASVLPGGRSSPCAGDSKAVGVSPAVGTALAAAVDRRVTHVLAHVRPDAPRIARSRRLAWTCP